MDLYSDANYAHEMSPCSKCRGNIDTTTQRKPSLTSSQRLIILATIVLFILSCAILACNVWILSENINIRKDLSTELHKAALHSEALQNRVEETHRVSIKKCLFLIIEILLIRFSLTNTFTRAKLFFSFFLIFVF